MFWIHFTLNSLLCIVFYWKWKHKNETKWNDWLPTAGNLSDEIHVFSSCTEPEMVSVFEGQTDSSTSIRLLWRAPSVGLYRGYLVSYSPADGDQSSPIELGPDEEELTITGLQFNQMYNVSIRSIMGKEGTYVESDPEFAMVTTGTCSVHLALFLINSEASFR